MQTRACLPEEIISVNKSKEYTLISTYLLEKVLTDNRLNAQTTKLWQLLFNKVRFNEELEIRVSYKELANQLGKSVRTISRYIETLSNNGYLLIKHNFYNNGSQMENTIKIRVPCSIMETVIKSRDRSINKNESTQINNYSKQFKPDKKISTNVPRITLPQPTINKAYQEKMPERYIISGKTPIETQVSSITSPPDILVREGHDNNVIQKESINIKINNNNTVVSFQTKKQSEKNISSSERQNEIKQQIIETQELLKVEQDKLLSLKDHTEIYLQTRIISELDGNLHVLQKAYEQGEKNIVSELTLRKADAELESDPYRIAKESGKRFPKMQILEHLVKKLSSYGYKGTALNKLANEIMFEARFGSLVYSNQTKNEIEIEKSLNIGLKLVREKRWTTPTQLFAFTKNKQRCVNNNHVAAI